MVAIDIPIGLVAAPTRAADRAARTFVGPRSSSVFPAPHPEVLDLTDHASVNRHLVAIEMPRVSAQAFHLFARIREVAGLAGDPRVIEAFPEASFCGMKGGHLRTTKKTWAGQHERRALLAAAQPPIVVPDDLGSGGLGPGRRRARRRRRGVVGPAPRPRRGASCWAIPTSATRPPAAMAVVWW